MIFSKSYFRKIAFSMALFSAYCVNNTYAATTSPLPDIYYGTLNNGFEYVLVPLENIDKNRVDIRLQVAVGSIDETDNEIGVAHMVEHMVFRATEDVPQGIGNKLADEGWIRGSHYNAVTNYERTQYMFSPPNGAKGINEALNVLKQMMSAAQFTPEDWQAEQKVVYEEWRGGLGVANRMNQQRVASIRHDSRYPTRPTIGTEQSILTTPVNIQAEFYHRWYQPNNMRLLIIGDIDVATTQAQIEQLFAPLQKHELPLRDYYEPKLKPQRHMTLLQDSQSGSSQVSIVFRLDDSLAKQQGFAAMKQRLINQITLSATTRQLRRQQENLPEGVSSLVIRKSDIGKTTVAVGLFASVLPEHHHVALTTLITEIERLKRYPLSEQEIDDIKQDLLETAQRMATSKEERDFAEWVQKLSIPLLNGEDYIGSQQVGIWAQEILAQLTVDDIKENLLRWIEAPDQVIQFSVPGNSAFTMPTLNSINDEWHKVEDNDIAPPQPKKEIVYTAFPDIKFAGQIVNETDYPQQNTTIWQLSNGDRVVWLKNPLAKDRIYFTAKSAIGYMSPEVSPWQSQLAVQLIKQTGPENWAPETFKAWLTDHQLTYNVDLSAESLQMQTQFKAEHLTDFLQLYTAMYQLPNIDAVSMKESLIAYARQQETRKASEDKDNALALLRYGHVSYQKPDIAALKALDADTLLAQWHTLLQAPTTFYFISDGEKSDLRPQIEQYLAGIPRQSVTKVPPYLPQSGARTATTAGNIEPRANVSIWSFTPYQWTPDAAANVYIAKQIAQYYLKTVLRDEALGIYRIRTNSTLNDKTDRIETDISFTCAPERYEELIDIIKSVFAKLPTLIDDSLVQQEKSQFVKQEAQRKLDIHTLQNRLLLSDYHYEDPRYLSTVHHLTDDVTEESIKKMASTLFNPDNLVINIVTPTQGKE